MWIYVHANAATLIDHLFVSLTNRDIVSAVIETDISDHYAITYATKHGSRSKTASEMYLQIQQNKVNQLIEQTNWQLLCDEIDAECLYNNFAEKNELYICTINKSNKE